MPETSPLPVSPLRKDAIRIRMYRVGFGDCFLISLPANSGHAHILVDCGVHSRGDIGTIESVVADVFEQTRREFAIVIGTHAHQDHLSAFGTFENGFRRCFVKEVWLPWTENPADTAAARLKEKNLGLIEHLQQHFAASPPSPRAAAALLNLAGNEKALQVLRSGINSASVRYLEAGAELRAPAGIEGLAVQVLGPPRDPEFLAKMNPPQGERFLRAEGTLSRPLNSVEPFRKKWVFDPAHLPGFPVLSEKECKLLEELSSDPEGLAFALDQAVNNTSLVILFAYRGKHLLFPGDAQYGNWTYWLRQPRAASVLAKIDFYKTGHHGSFNATPKRALQQMPHKQFAAMASTQEAPWSSIPLPKLMAALEERAAGLVRSDSISVRGAPKGPVPAKLPPGFTQGKLWFDYELPC